MKFIKTNLKGCYKIKFPKFEDNRGNLVKIYVANEFKKNIKNIKFKEIFYSFSKKNVIRGMHFQIPPSEHSKLVYVISGEIIDVILDIRKTSLTYGKYITINLSEKNNLGVFIPPGFAHGFKIISESATVVYNTTKEHSKENDKGIYWNSFGFDWKIQHPIISERDQKFPFFEEFKSPF